MIEGAERPIAAAIDIGSNSIKMTVARHGEHGSQEQLDWASEVVRLGQGLEETGRLDDRRIEAAVAAIARFADRARAIGASSVVAVATEATRVAANRSDFLGRVRQETGIDVRVLSGQEEADLTFRGLAAASDVRGTVVVADVGGGSTELIVAIDGTVQAARSVPLGSGRLTDRLIHADPPTPEELAASEAEAREVLESAARIIDFPRGDEARLVIVGGTGEYMVRLVPPGTNVNRKVINGMLGKLAVLTAAELADAIEAPEARARVLPAGVAIVAAIADRVEPARIEVSRSGIRAGLLAEQFEQWEADSDATTAELAGEPTFREAMRELIAERWAVVWNAVPAAVEGAASEGVHDVRVASRRLRAAMDIAAPAFSPKWYRPLQRVAKEITGALGSVRDRDVLLEALRAERAAAPVAEHPGIDRLIAEIDAERMEARTQMERYLGDLVRGPWAAEIERRFGPTASPSRPRTPSVEPGA